MKQKILYCGDSPIGGASTYLYAVLKKNRYRVTHIAPHQKLPLLVSKSKFNLIIISDYSKKNITPNCEDQLVRQVRNGTSLLMVGGWASFTGKWGGYRGSQIESLLPVTCSKNDDRLNYASGLMLSVKQQHPIIRGVRWNNPPVICGLNKVSVSKQSKVVLEAVALKKGKLQKQRRYPLLVTNHDKDFKSAVFTCDFAPHWCGGLVDWGTRRVRLKASKNAQVEVGDQYIAFISQMTRWLLA